MKKFSFTLFLAVISSLLCAQATKLKNNLLIFGGIEVNNRVVFAMGNGQVGYTDATTMGTNYVDAGKVLLDFNGLSAGLGQNKFYFTGINAAQGSELWVTDGTEAGTKIVKDIVAGPGSAQIEAPNDRGNFPMVNNNIYFVANDGVNGRQLWKSDGTEAGTQLVKVIRAGADPEIRFPELTDSNFYAGEDFYFMANNGLNGLELWKTNGTAAGTVMVADITPGPASTTFGGTFIGLCGTLIFMANNGATGMELWRTNGTPASTYQLRDIAPGNQSAFRNDPEEELNGFTFRNKYYFTAFEGGADFWQNEQMWVTDGTPAGTKAVTNLNPMQGGFHARLKDNSSSVIKGGRFYFMVQDYNFNPLSLWSSDGTTNGTQPVKFINSIPPDYGNPNYRSPLGRILMPERGFSEDEVAQSLFKGNSFFMIADDGVHKRQLWISDGTEAGTQMLLVNPNGHGVDSNEYYIEDFYYRITQDHIYFTGINNASGMELWRSDGTQAGTTLLYDAWPGPTSSMPVLLGLANGKLIFQAKDGNYPNPNLYRLDASLIDYTSGGFVSLCPGGSTVLRSNITGTTSTVWQVNTPSGWVNLPEGGNFSGTNTPALVLSNMPSTSFGWQFRCVADGNIYSNAYTIIFVAFWTGAADSEWENPANWHCGAVPDSNTIVTIQCAFGNTPVVSTHVQCRTLMLHSGQSLYVAPTGKVTVTHENN